MVKKQNTLTAHLSISVFSSVSLSQKTTGALQTLQLLVLLDLEVVPQFSIFLTMKRPKVTSTTQFQFPTLLIGALQRKIRIISTQTVQLSLANFCSVIMKSQSLSKLMSILTMAIQQFKLQALDSVNLLMEPNLTNRLIMITLIFIHPPQIQRSLHLVSVVLVSQQTHMLLLQLYCQLHQLVNQHAKKKMEVFAIFQRIVVITPIFGTTASTLVSLVKLILTILLYLLHLSQKVTSPIKCATSTLNNLKILKTSKVLFLVLSSFSLSTINQLVVINQAAYLWLWVRTLSTQPTLEIRISQPRHLLHLWLLL